MSDQSGIDPKVIVAMDFSDINDCIDFASQIEAKSCRLKIGKEMFTRYGPGLVEQLQSMGFELFLDLKFHDIPNTVARAVQSAAALGVWMVNVHALGGARMLEAAKESIANYEFPPKLIAVTILTSMSQEDWDGMGFNVELTDQVKTLAVNAKNCGLDGVVCSAQEASIVKSACGLAFSTVTPGIRLQDSPKDDQRRVMTPKAALANGSDYLVIGRPITQSENPQQVLESINQEIYYES